MEVTLGTLAIAFTGGLFMFLAPCTLPLVPAFLASLAPNHEQGRNNLVYIVALRTILFSLGFTVIFVTFGVLTGLFASAFASYKYLFAQIGGVIIIFFGIALMPIERISFIQNTLSRISVRLPQPKGKLAPFSLGALFALGWTPCAGPILASILFIASQEGGGIPGGITLLAFSLGLAVPFILIGILYGHTLKIFKLYERYQIPIAFLSGIFLIIVGAIIAFGHSIPMTHWGFALYSFFGYTPMCTIL